ncbi:ATP phosphoribosyltransferase regulatory subunit [Caminibacter pacificus]|uniref:ATP phosphoribosyltransferase regulatory subunit n=1 Tax=Caminibacter pacificus TaxID=1424653 RepID=A0AAJ4UXG7_9BACT|nr:ATP phosphoribosyltransferase regulatory subunit [Caminibacter pacificus]QCI29049.1 ATP phosphoribosyltransferase regulatory subunit [Caminibacter pacificus]ROR39134.1 ATP phosphoribosyltransferase regulatory subunit HisZ [Caminibacter pacificus]
MIFAHDIPDGAKLYFGKKAKIKREIEHIASEVFENEEYEEIVSPYFSYHQLEALSEKELIRFTDRENRSVALRGDSSIDIIRIVLKRLKSEAKKWFYIQPVFRAPSTEINQIGAEWLEGNIEDVLNTNINILNRLSKKYPLILSHIQIPKEVCKLTGLDIEDIKKMRIYKFEEPWLKELLKVNSIEDLEDLSKYPQSIAESLKELKKVAKEVNYDIILAPLYVANLRYYTGVFYRFINKNDVIAKGGEYVVESVKSAGFSIYTDNLLKDLDD